MNPSSEQSNSLLEKKHDYPLRSCTKDSKHMKIVVSPKNIITSSRIMKEDNTKMDPMWKITNNHVIAQMAY